MSSIENSQKAQIVITKHYGTIIKRPTIFQRFFTICSQYWYVAVPIHIVTSCIWFGGCYHVSQQGFDILKVLKKLHVKDDLIDFFKNTSMGHLTVSFALYKLLAPLRVATTLYCSSVAIKHLSRAGLIKPAQNPFRKRKKKN